MKRIGILTCSNTTQDIGCSSYGCLAAAYDRQGEFTRYGEDVRVVGIINCAGCPGVAGHDKILKRVSALAASGVEVLHLSSCLANGCPFVAKYEKVIREAHPGMDVVRGTHPPYTAAAREALYSMMHDELVRPGKTVPEIVREIRETIQG